MNPQVEAARHALATAQSRLMEARFAHIPTGSLDLLMAPAPRVECALPDYIVTTASPEERASKEWRARHCLTTPSLSTAQLVGIDGFFVRFEMTFLWPIFTFGKIGAAKEAAEAGIRAGQGTLAKTRADLELQVARAYYGLKLARELRSMLDEGKEHIVKAIRRIKEDLDEGKGSSTVTDLRRLQVLDAEVDARRLEAERGEALALAALRALLPGLGQFDIDEEPLDFAPSELKPLADYQEMARRSRPEVHLLEGALQARTAALKAQKAMFLPDLVLVGKLSYAYTSSADMPHNAFYNNPLNGLGFGGGLALRLTWDYGLKVARLRRAEAELREAKASRQALLAGIVLEVEKARAEAAEARARLKVLEKGERAAKAWLEAIAQKHAVGLAETREFADALGAFFQMRLRWLQAVHDACVAQGTLRRATSGE